MLELFVIIIALCSVDHVGLCACFYLPVRERGTLLFAMSPTPLIHYLLLLYI